MTASDGERVQHDPERQRFTMAIEGGVAVLQYRPIDATTLDYHHTFVPPALRGRGLASELTAFALRFALDRDLKVVANCPFVAAYVSRHAEFEAVLAA